MHAQEEAMRQVHQKQADKAMDVRIVIIIKIVTFSSSIERTTGTYCFYGGQAISNLECFLKEGNCRT